MQLPYLLLNFVVCTTTQMAGYEVLKEEPVIDESPPGKERSRTSVTSATSGVSGVPSGGLAAEVSEHPAEIGGLDTPSHHAVIFSRDRAMKDFKAFFIEQVGPIASVCGTSPIPMRQLKRFH